jgi:hypothetical protein
VLEAVDGERDVDAVATHVSSGRAGGSAPRTSAPWSTASSDPWGCSPGPTGRSHS